MAEVKIEEWMRKAAQRLRTLYGTVIMEAPEYLPSVEDGIAEIARAYAESGQQNYEAWIASLPKCLGDEIGCEGNLVGMPHEEACPMFGKQFATMRDAFEAGRRAESGQDEYRRGIQDAKGDCFQCEQADLKPSSVSLTGLVNGEPYTVQINGLRCPNCDYQTIEGSDTPHFRKLLTEEYKRTHKAERSPYNSERDEYRRGWKAAKEAARAVSSAKYTVVFKLRQFAPNEVSRQELEVSGRFISEVEAEIGALEPDEHYRVGQEEK
jgi:hypothetical protein